VLEGTKIKSVAGEPLRGWQKQANDLIDAEIKNIKNTKPTAVTALEKEALKYNTFQEFLKAQGEPLKHGTTRNYKNFSSSELGKNTMAPSAKEGVFFTDSPRISNSYALDNNMVGEKYLYELAEKRDALTQSTIKKASELKGDDLLAFQEWNKGERERVEEIYKEYIEKGFTKDDMPWDEINEIILKETDDEIKNATSKSDKIALSIIRDNYESKIIDTEFNDLYRNMFDADKRFKLNIGESSDAIDGADIDYREAYNNTKPQTRIGYLEFNNPMEYDFKGKAWREETYKSIIDEAKAKGHDGLILKNTRDPYL
jgi:hypothetical protein